MRFGLGRGNREFDRSGYSVQPGEAGTVPALYFDAEVRRRGEEDKGESTPENAEEAEGERLAHLGMGGTPRLAVLRATW